MYIFLDTEFTHFDCPVEGLISIAATNESGASWYGVNKDTARSECSEFVLEHVLPILYTPAPDQVESLVVLGNSLAHWIEAQGPQAMVVVDYVGDWFLMMELFALADAWPKNLSRRLPEYLYSLIAKNDPEAMGRIDAETTAFLLAKGWAAHNARADAEANWHLWRSSLRAHAAAQKA